MKYPPMFRLAQKLRGPTIQDVPEAIEAELSKLNLQNRVKPGETVAGAFATRWTAHYPAILKAVSDHVRKLKATPFLLLPVSNHCTGVAERPQQVLRALGISEEIIGAEIRSPAERAIIGHLSGGLSVYFDKHALSSDHTILVSRVQPHPLFRGDVQSGLLELISIGLGNIDAAQLVRLATEESPFEDFAGAVHKLVEKEANLRAGLMVVHNGRQSIARLQAARPEHFVKKEKAMLHFARGLAPRLPFKFIDILLVDEIGATFGCLGADLDVIGRKYHPHAPAEQEFPKVTTIVYRALNEASHGDATGVGHAEFVRSRLLRNTDVMVTRLNSLAIGFPTLAAAPIDFETDKEILDAALSLSGSDSPERARIVWIRNTSSLIEFECSEPYLEEVHHWTDLSVLGRSSPLAFDAHGNLRDFVIDYPLDSLSR